MTRIAVDAMGGDNAPFEIVAGAVWAAAEYGVQFLYRDFRPLFKAGQEKARVRGTQWGFPRELRIPVHSSCT